MAPPVSPSTRAAASSALSRCGVVGSSVVAGLGACSAVGSLSWVFVVLSALDLRAFFAVSAGDVFLLPMSHLPVNQGVRDRASRSAVPRPDRTVTSIADTPPGQFARFFQISVG